MTLTDVDRQLPNGFHDAYLLRFAVDYAKATLTLDLNFLVGMPDGKTREPPASTGQATWHEAETHASEYIGTGTTHVLLVELKESAGGK